MLFLFVTLLIFFIIMIIPLDKSELQEDKPKAVTDESLAKRHMSILKKKEKQLKENKLNLYDEFYRTHPHATPQEFMAWTRNNDKTKNS